MISTISKLLFLYFILLLKSLQLNNSNQRQILIVLTSTFKRKNNFRYLNVFQTHYLVKSGLSLTGKLWCYVHYPDLKLLKGNLLSALVCTDFIKVIHCVKSVSTRSFCGPCFSRIWTEYRHFLCQSPYSVQMRENTGQKNSEYGHILRTDT